MRLAPALLALALVAAACGGGADPDPRRLEPPKTPEDTAERFLTLWKERKYADMYDLVSSEAKLAITQEEFVGRYEAITDEATITDVDFTSETEPLAGARRSPSRSLSTLRSSAISSKTTR